MHVVLEGRANGTMPAWKQLSDVELAAVLTYVKNHWSNQTGQLIQPAQFAAARQGKFPEGGTVVPSAEPLPAAQPSAPAAETPAGPTGSVSNEMPVQVFFATGQSALDVKAQEQVKVAAAWLSAHADVKVALSGFVDATGSADVNAELAKQRAQAVAKGLTDAGIAVERIELRKPQTITDSTGADEQARRVDIVAAQ